MTESNLVSLSDLFTFSARRYPQRAAVWVDGCSTTYEELDHRAQLIAGLLIANLREKPERQCALLVDRSTTAYAAVLGVLMAGLTYVPVNCRLPVDRMSRIVETSLADSIIIDEHCVSAARELLAACACPLLVLLPDSLNPPDWALGMSRHRFFCRADIEQLALPVMLPLQRQDHGAYLLFTSGSTGLAKGVLIRHGSAISYIQNVRERYKPVAEDRFSQLFDFSFDLSVHDMFLCWSAGACLYCVPSRAKAAPRDFVRTHELTFWFSVPSTVAFMSRMRSLKPGDFPSLRWSLFCGEALPMRLAAEWQAAAPNSTVENLYGPTEATVAFTAYRVRREESEKRDPGDIAPIGWPLPGQQIAILDAEGFQLPDGEAGELCLGGSQVARGYWNLPDQTAERFAVPRNVQQGINWYRTGDLALNTSKQGLLFLGRIDRQVKIRGHRVELQEIEAVIRSASGTDTVAVVPWPILGNRLAVGVVAFLSDRKAETREIMEACRRRLPDYMQPSQLHDITVWPLNANGKTDYAALHSLLNTLQ